MRGGSRIIVQVALEQSANSRQYQYTISMFDTGS